MYQITHYNNEGGGTHTYLRFSRQEKLAMNVHQVKHGNFVPGSIVVVLNSAQDKNLTRQQKKNLKGKKRKNNSTFLASNVAACF